MAYPHYPQVKRRTGKVRRPETDVLPLCHATNEAHVAEAKSFRLRLTLSGLGVMASGLGLTEIGLVASNIYSAHDIN